MGDRNEEDPYGRRDGEELGGIEGWETVSGYTMCEKIDSIKVGNKKKSIICAYPYKCVRTYMDKV